MRCKPVAATQKPILKVSTVVAWLVKLHWEIDWPVSFLINLTQTGVPLRYHRPRNGQGGEDRQLKFSSVTFQKKKSCMSLPNIMDACVWSRVD